MRLNYPEILPITAHRAEIVKAIEENQVVIVVGETGSGKSTQIPKMILEALASIKQTDPSLSHFKIACTQPRRLAAVSISTWIAHEMDVVLGKEVGYKIRFDDDTTEGTMITVCTDGILLQEMKGDSLLSRYDAVLVDEAHERNLNIDFLLGLIKDIQGRRSEAGLERLKVLITSATFDAGKFADFFADLNVGKDGKKKEIPVVNVSGRLFPVDIHYSELGSRDDIYIKIAEKIRGIVDGGDGGDVLIFMPGEGEIFQTIREIDMLGRGAKIKCLPLYSRLSMEDQELIYGSYPGKTKIVVATNIAETSLTVPGIKYVIDAGTARQTDFNFRTGIGSLEIKPISQASAIQRAGRAGRVQAGVCIRLYSEADFTEREKYTKPEIQRSDLSSVVLHMRLMGITNLESFSFIDAPQHKAFHNAIANLIELGALDESQNLTDLGIKMAHLPLEPRISAMLLAAEKYRCVREVAIIASSLSVKDPFLRPKEDEEEADRAKRFFQRLATGETTHYKVVRIRKGKKVFTRRVVDRVFSDQGLASDLVVFLVIWNKLQTFKTPEEREVYCQGNYLNFLMFKEIEQIYRQLLDTLNIFAKEEFAQYLLGGAVDLSIDLSKKEGILKSIASGFIQNLCESSGKQTYQSRNADNIFIHPGSALFPMNPKFFVSAEIVETTRLFARNNTVIDPAWFEEIAPQLCKVKSGQVWFDRKSGQAVREEEVYFRGVRIVKDRLVNVSKFNPELAQEYLIGEGLIKKQLVNEFPWLLDNEKTVAQLKTYAGKLNRDEWAYSPARMREWYAAKIRESGKKVATMGDLKRLLAEKGEDYFTMKIEQILSPKERKEIDSHFPEEIYLAGERLPVRYYYQDYRFPDGPVVFLEVGDLFKLSDEVVAANLQKNSRLKPHFVVTSGEGQQDEIASGESIDEIKRDVDRWHLKKFWRKLKRDIEVRGIRIDEIWHFWEHQLERKEVGGSLFEKGPNSMVYAYVGLRMEGRKIIRTLFEDREVARLMGVVVLKQLFVAQSKYGVNFKESQILALEKRWDQFFRGINVVGALGDALWKVLDFEGRLADVDKFKNVEWLKSFLESERAKLPDYKEKIINKFEKKLTKIEALAGSGRAEDLDELSKLKKMIEAGQI